MNQAAHQKFEKMRRAIRGATLLAALLALAGAPPPDTRAALERRGEAITVTANFTGRELAPDEPIELNFSRPLAAGEGRLALFVGATDLTALCEIEGSRLGYRPSVVPLPAGETRVAVYLVAPDNLWRPLAEFALKIKTGASGRAPTAEKLSPETKAKSATSAAALEFTPSLALNVKGQNQTLTFPREPAPARNPFTDLAGQGGFSLKVSRSGWTLSSRFDFAGSSFGQEALRFGQLGERAPRIDLASYLVELKKGRFKADFGHVSFGSNRHLISGFSSRGLSVTVPVGRRNELSFAAMNGTSVVGFDNFFGLARRRHQVMGLTFAREFVRERPGGLRAEFSVMRGSLLPLANFNQGAVTDAERSSGFGFKVLGNKLEQRLRWEAGVTRSRFTNPADPQLEQNRPVTRIEPVWRTARYGELSFDFLQGLKIWREKKLKLTGTYRHERIEPLYRSLGVATQADRAQNQFEVTASFGEINFAYGNLRDRDNLSDIASILKTLNRRHNVIFSVALGSFFTPAAPRKWLPSVSYSYDFTRQFGASLPVNGEFRDLSQVPDQDSFAQNFNAVWQFSERLNLSYRYQRAFQDNRQPGRDRADFTSAVNAVTLGAKPFGALDLDFELSRERQKNFEQPRLDRTFRFGTRATWRTPFLSNSAFSAVLSTTLAGDAGNQTDARNAEFDVQWAYKFGLGTKKYKKVEAQFFIRYANRYANAVERLNAISNFNKTQAFNFGLNFNVF